MTVPAADAQGAGEEAHSAHELVYGNTFQHLDVLEGHFGHLRPRRPLILTLREGRTTPG